ncbi:hypothetical protein RJ639_023773 [Escallonia herrerae]|uniref:Disease resistance RPP13-like protein 4 n=1 Tax=Escallonia herrerae TaxID=1293975 RepID=A0AA88UZY9_9ASTE|nr:hypothetical protein RJ639_023773 [Escallonia herrerae]
MPKLASEAQKRETDIFSSAGFAVVTAVVQLLVNDLARAIYAQSSYALEYQTLFDEMTKQLTYMQSFLTDAEKLKGKHETVKTTLIDLRELIYEADDLVIDCLIRAAYLDKRKSSTCCHLSPREIFFRYQTGKKLTAINKRIVKMHQNLSIYVTPIFRQPSGDSSGTSAVRWTSQVFDQSQIVGLKEDAIRIKGWILPQNEVLHRVGIVGMGGLGKTTITQTIFNDTRICARFQNKIWVSVSQTVNETEIMKSMLRQLQADDSGSDGNLQFKICQVLSSTSYLIVMDDVWSVDSGWWDRISCGLPKTAGYSSCVIITSRIEGVVKRMGVVEERIHRPRPLNEDESWSLFCKVAFISTKEIYKNKLEEIAKTILRKCSGLPLAIKTTGGLLSSKKQNYYEWKRVSDDFRQKLAAESRTVMASLQLSYDELPPHLKHCILCFSIYPEDHEIKAEQLVRWWVGEGFVHDKGSDTATDVAFSCLAELISRCLVEVVQPRSYNGRVYSCKMHDMVRDMTILIAREEAFSSFDEGGKHISTVDSRRLGVTETTNYHTLEGNTKLRALLLMTSHSIPFSRSIGLATVNSVRVLDLSHVNLDTISMEDLCQWISTLKRLAYLNLRAAAGLVELPYTFGRLWGLQILILDECKYLTKLPASITTLPKLTVLDIGNCPALQYLPQGISTLTTLQELHGFKISRPTNTEGCHLGELKCLTQLRVLQVDINEESIIDDEELTALAQLQHLKLLLINANNCEDANIIEKLNNLSPPPCLEEVYLGHYYGESSPNWLSPTSLPQLQYLCIEDARALNVMNPLFWGDAERTWRLESLCLKYLPRLEAEWAEVQRAMPALSFLKVSHCYKLQSFPCNVKALGVWNKDEDEKEDGKPEDVAYQPEECQTTP